MAMLEHAKSAADTRRTAEVLVVRESAEMVSLAGQVRELLRFTNLLALSVERRTQRCAAGDTDVQALDELKHLLERARSDVGDLDCILEELSESVVGMRQRLLRTDNG